MVYLATFRFNSHTLSPCVTKNCRISWYTTKFSFSRDLCTHPLSPIRTSFDMRECANGIRQISCGSVYCAALGENRQIL